jgi:enoyl-[acyl-carrier protein] reductase II
MTLRTALCDLLGIEHPILSVGMGAGARAELVSAVSNAGGFGVLGASGRSRTTSAPRWSAPGR